MALVLFFIITANVMQKTEVDQNLLVFLRQLIAGVLAIKKRQYKDPQDMLDAMVLKQMLLRITQRRSNGAESEKVLCDRCQELRNNCLRRWDHVFFLNNQFGTRL